MENATKNEKAGPKRKKGETLKEKIDRHLQDQTDKITDEDLRDVKVGEAAIPDLKKKSKEMSEEVPKDKNTTPWDILNEE